MNDTATLATTIRADENSRFLITLEVPVNSAVNLEAKALTAVEIYHCKNVQSIPRGNAEVFCPKCQLNIVGKLQSVGDLRDIQEPFRN